MNWKKFRESKICSHWFILIPPLFYFFTMATKMALGDVALMVHRMEILDFGIHPNLHNLAMVVGHAFLQLPFGSVVYRANLMTVTFGATAVIAFYFLLNKLKLRKIVVISGSFIFMVSHSVWWHSTMAENYILHVFMIVVIITCFVDYTQNKRIWPLYLAFFLAGLSFFNHVQNGVWWGGCYLFLIFNFFDLPKNGKIPYLYGKIFKENRKFIFYWVFLVSSIFLLIGIAPYLWFLLKDFIKAGYDLSRTFNTGAGGEFKNIMFNFDNLNGLRQSFWYHFLQFPSPFFFLTVTGLIYVVFGGLIHRFIKEQKSDSKAEKIVFRILLSFLAFLFVLNVILLYFGFTFNIGGIRSNWFRYDGAIKIFISAGFLAIAFLIYLRRKGWLQSPFKRDISKVFYAIYLIPFVVTTLFFQFYNTWDQFQFLLPCYIIYAFTGVYLLNDIVVVIEKSGSSKARYFRWFVIACCFFSVVMPIVFYEKIGEWSQDPSTWWFNSGPYSDRKFINSHNRTEYNYNPNKSNYDDVDDFVNLLFEKLPKGVTIVDDDSRMFYSVNIYYRKYAQRKDKGRPDIKWKMINVWGHKHWGMSIKRAVKLINSKVPGSDDFFLMANRNYPHRQIVRKLDPNDRIFLPWKLSNDKWIYKLKVFTEEEKQGFGGEFPPLNFNYMYFGKDFKKNGLNKLDVFSTEDKVEARVKFDRLSKKTQTFAMRFLVSDETGKEFLNKRVKMKGGFSGLKVKLSGKESYSPGKYNVVVSVKGIIIFERSFEVK